MRPFVKNTILRRAVCAIAMLVSAFLLVGCGASLTVYDYTDGGVRYNLFELSIDRDVVDNMEKTAAPDEDGKPYTVADYFYELFTSYGCELVSAELTADAYTVSYRKAYYGEPELFEIGSAVEFEYSYVDNPFVRSVTSTAPNPFNGVRADYDSVRAGQSGTLIQQLKNGKVAVDEYGEQVVLFPSIQMAFPYLDGIDPSGLLLGYARAGSSRMNSSGVALGSGKTRTYLFTRYFDDAETEIAFSYTRPVPYGWYLVAAAAGGIVVAAFVLATRNKTSKKEKPSLKERFPYDPEDISGGGNLPM